MLEQNEELKKKNGSNPDKPKINNSENNSFSLNSL